jgi:protein gp37
MNPHWARTIRDECKLSGIPFYFKQWGEWRPFLPQDGPPRESKHAIDEQWDIIRVGKHAAGRLLDGVEHDGFPASSSA